MTDKHSPPAVVFLRAIGEHNLKNCGTIAGLMTSTPKVMCLIGSMTPNGNGARMMDIAMRAVEAAGGQANLWDVHAKRLPFFGETWADDNVAEFKQQALEADAFLLCTPEYHGTISGLMKNQIDWLSFDQFSDKPVALMSTLGGQSNSNALNHMRLSLRHVHAIVIREQAMMPHTKQAWNEDGTLADEGLQSRIEKMATKLIETVHLLR